MIRNTRYYSPESQDQFAAWLNMIQIDYFQYLWQTQADQKASSTSTILGHDLQYSAEIGLPWSFVEIYVGRRL
jgi:hypothetical protein